MRKGIKITAKILLMVLFPLFFISIIAIVMCGNNQEDTAYQLIEEKLEAVALNKVYMMYIQKVITHMKLEYLRKGMKYFRKIII